MTQNAQHAVQGGAVSMCIDEAGRLHVATRPGAQVFIPQGPFPFAVLTLERHGPPLSYDLPF